MDGEQAVSETTDEMPENNVIMVASNGDTVGVEYQQNGAMSPTFSLPPAFEENAAVSVRNGYKSYRKGSPVLSDFNMTVPSGTIYSLLGSSGCGKTTMLSCCVGIRNLDSGEIFVFGHKPGTKASGVPGGRVGFMPQELSVYEQLTIQEALNFYGQIYGMQREQIHESITFLVDFLDLPASSRRVGTLSGGQKRRVSMALALIHDPELLILDEPTVGVDPLLRETIWSHLVELVTSGRTTVIITTHYVEEARQSNMIGIMRNGRLLTEKSPQALLKEFNTNLLEDIVLSLSRMDREERKRAKGQNVEGSKESEENVKVEVEDEENPKEEWKLRTFTARRKVGHSESKVVEAKKGVNGFRYSASPPKADGEVQNNNDKNEMENGHAVGVTTPSTQVLQRRLKSARENIQRNESTISKRLIALLIKNYITLIRNVGFLIFIFFLPVSQVVLICLTLGSDPKGLHIGVINPEACDFMSKNWREKIMDECPMDSGGNETRKGMLSCFYLAHLPVESFIMEREVSEASALHKIQQGYTYGYIEFPEGFTENVICRLAGLCSGDTDASLGANIILELDMSNKQIGHTMKRIFIETYVETMERIKDTCKSTISEETLESAGDVPYTFKKPVYGKDNTSFIEFLAPSILLGILFFFPLCSSGVSYITEKKTGTLDRALVAGVRTTELMGGFLLSQVGILVCQAGFSFLILILVYKIEVIGSVSLALFLTILVGLSGMSAGFLIAMFCSEEVQAVLLAIGTFFPNILLAGMVWPIEGMDRYLQYVSYLLPCTLACESMRSIVSRGWALTHRCVWPGFISTFVWIAAYWILALLVNRYKSKG